MIPVDNVYQTVLAAANKEQRGYITPQEFNIFASQAQLEIFEQYFYDLSQFDRLPGNEDLHYDMRDILEEKISIFSDTQNVTLTNGTGSWPNDMYRAMNIFSVNNRKVEQIKRKDVGLLSNTSILNPIVQNNGIDRYYWYHTDANTFTTYPTTNATFTVEYVRRPVDPNWTYVVVDHKAMYNPAAGDHEDFELHASDQAELVSKILTLCGISMKDPQVSGAAMAMENQKIQQEKR